MTTVESAADVQVPDNGEHPSPENVAGPPQAIMFSFVPEGPEFGPPSGVPATRKQVDYGGPIVVPAMGAIVLPDTGRWLFRQLHKVEKRVEDGASQLELPLFWLEQAQVDESLIDRIMLLPGPEWERFFQAWMSGAADSNLGE